MKIPELRRSEICRLVLERKRATVKGLAISLKVSEETIRRDINILYSRGYLVKVHGGVVAPDIPGLGTFKRRSDHLAKEKLAIAKAARNLVKPGESLMIDAGSTMNIFSEVTNLVTDRNPPERFVKLMKESGTNLVVAKTD